MATKDDLKLIYDTQKETILLGSSCAALNWDVETYMPKKGIDFRSEQISLLDKKAHETVTQDKVWDALKRLNKPASLEKLSKKDQIVVKRFYKEVEKDRKIPTALVTELSKTIMIANNTWKKAKQNNDFKLFAPHLEKLLKLRLKQAKYIGLPGHIYNSRLDSFEEGMTVKQLKPIFEKLKPQLIKLLNDIKKTDTYKKQKDLVWNFDAKKLEGVSRWIYDKLVLDKDRSRLDISTHPFTTSLGPDDVRITSRYRNPLESFFIAVHESGHALYELNLPREYIYTTVFDAASFGLHESQSRFLENNIARSKPVVKQLFSQLKTSFPKTIKDMNVDDFYKQVNLVKPGLIRVEADEVTYCLHIILRFELELALFEGKLKVKDLAKEWNKRMEDYFGITPPTDTDGVLQDVHWSWGEFGYFPTYALGTIYAAQINDKIKKDIPDLDKKVAKLDFKALNAWSKKHIHKYGASMLADDIIKKSCGMGLDIDAYVKYLRTKYSQIYGF
jgi:carboxypeptidase Taq